MNCLNRVMTILMVDDDPEDYYLVKAAMMENGLPNDLRHVSDGEKLMDYLSRRGKYKDPESSLLPCLILLDLNMPGKDGREVLRDIKTDPASRHIPVVVFTTSSEADDIVESYRMGASSFINKPHSFDSLLETMSTVWKYWLKVAQLPTQR
jgi:CheY-like chemotaxis protein